MSDRSQVDWIARFDARTAENSARDLAEREAVNVKQLFARARARVQIGRDEEARADFAACVDEMGDAARVEIAYLDVRGRGSVESACEELEAIAARADPCTELAARAVHLLGLARGKLRRPALALDALLCAAERYRARGDAGALAQVQDTLGSLFAAQGRLDIAASHYAASIAGKLRASDAAGIAISLGNLGRLHLRSGRYAEAIDCFRLDLDIAERLADERGTARMHEDIGRAWMGLERWDDARAEFKLALATAEARCYRDIEFFAHHDLALTAIARGLHADAELHVSRAEQALAEPRDTFLDAMLASVRGRLLAATSAASSLPLLTLASERFASLELPDHEIPVRLALAEALLATADHAGAERELRRTLDMARRDGYARYLPQIREAMSHLQIVESAVFERDRLGPPGSGPTGADGYVLLALLGKGGFGEVWRAYDPQRAQVVALKRFALERLYQPEKRDSVIASARTELAAASRLRHPGIARVHAFGTDGANGAYVVQEHVDGPTLRSRMSARVPDSPGRVLEQAGRIARALQTLHGIGVVHRDLKPENVLLRMPGELPVLIDFGLALVPGTESDPNRIAGTLAYMAPEQAAGRPLDGAADLHALGVILYEWFAGRRPFLLQSGGLDHQLHVLQHETPRPLAEVRPDLGPECTQMVDALLEKDPLDRPDVEEIAAHCETWARKLLGRV